MSPSSKSKVYFFYKTALNLKKKSALKRFIESIFKNEGYSLQCINYIFCTDKQVLKINKQFLKHNYYTDIITFELSEQKKPVLGEIYISVGRVKANAALMDEPCGRELLRVIFHGALHLCGYSDKLKGEIKKMRERENYYLEKYMGTRFT